MLVDGLGKLIPECGFITEEETASGHEKRYRWIIDPLDGTTNFVHGVPCYAVSVALADGDDIVLGIVHEVNQDECFWSHQGVGAFLNEKPMNIGKDVWFVGHCIVSPINAADKSMAMVGSVVTKDVPPFAIVAGSPAKIIGYRFEPHIINQFQKLAWWNWSDEMIKKNKSFFKQEITEASLNQIVL